MKAPAAMKGMHFVIEPSVLDCLGCGNCADICPGNPKTDKALTMVPFNPDAADMKQEAKNWDKNLPTNNFSFKRHTKLKENLYLCTVF